MFRILTRLKNASAAPINTVCNACSTMLAALAATVETWLLLIPQILSILAQIVAGCAVLYAWWLLALYLLGK